jgi:hypothetical protein
MRCFLLNSKEHIIHSFDAADLAAARVELRVKCMQDQTSYMLAVIVRKGTFTLPPMLGEVTDEPAP